MDGYYLISVQIYGRDNDATHSIDVNGNPITYSYQYNQDSFTSETSNPAIVVQLNSGDVVTIDTTFGSTLSGNAAVMRNYLSITLLYTM